ncbi:hypothetical protein H0E87_027666 [Populus deltoides]|uniref:Mediator of RNA polymerase II transcription subunit 6 n=1 Tax=Populus deltoides TaxID=3696 RepID=A0A8T2WS90_POPDE|nr:hypothetical protein H0E87_027666 [Populus deltoides]
MATPPVLPQLPTNFEANPPPMGPTPPQQPPGTDMTGICFRDQLWLNTYPLDRNLVFDYFALSPFYDWTCNNEQLRSQSIHPLDLSHLLKMTGTEYMLSEVMEPHLFVFRKQKRDSAEKVTPMLTYYVLDGSIYQAPQLCSVFAARVGRALYYISKAFGTAASKLEKIGYGIALLLTFLFYLVVIRLVLLLKVIYHVFSLNEMHPWVVFWRVFFFPSN